MKKSISILLSILTLISAVSCIDFSIYAGDNARKFDIASDCNFDPTGGGYEIDNQSSQFDFYENYSSIENLKVAVTQKDKSFYPTKDLYTEYAQKLGITTGKLTDYQKVAKIYYFMSQNLKSSGTEMVSELSLLISRRGYCEVFAAAFMELCQRANIECWTISTTGHEWNIVKVDGKYYECDTMNGITFMGNMNKVINTYSSSWMEIMNYDASEHYSGNDALKKWSAKYKNSISTSDYVLPKETTGLDTPKTTVTATDEGIVVKWDAVSNADWYEVYYANIDGITNNASKLSKGQSMWDTVTIKYNDGDYAYFKYGTSSCDSQGNIYFKNAGKTIHSIDKNEKGQYQFFINNDKPSGYGTAIVVVAKNVDNKTSASTRDAKAMAEIIGTNLVTQTVTSIDKNTNETIKGTTILKINESNYAINKDYNANSHNFSVKVATPIQATKNAQGAEVYECPECLQRKMVYTKALNDTGVHEHIIDWTVQNGSLVKMCSGCRQEFSRLQFEDLESFVGYGDFVEYTSVNNSFLKGTNPPEFTEFSPTASITRAMFVTILYRMAGEPYKNENPYPSTPFTDITDTSVYYYDAACWALKNGVTTETTFKPDNYVNREQTASFLFRYAESENLLGSYDYLNVNLSDYPDYDDISDWAEEAIQWANFNGMITGTMQGYINPQGVTQRIHATKILYGFGKVCNIGNFE